MSVSTWHFLSIVGTFIALLCVVLIGLGLLIAGLFIFRHFRQKKPVSPPSPQPPLASPPAVAATVALPKCPQCHLPLAPNSPEGLCPTCLARVALDTEPVAPAPTINVTPPAEAAPGTRVPPDPAQLAAQFPHLEIIELLGMGGMGMVYKARQPRLDRIVALKILPVDSQHHPSFAERFGREAKALAKLNHPGIVDVYDFGQTNEYYYFVMEYVDGMNLRSLLNNQTVTPRQALELVVQICTALQYAHDEGVVHRDIKPENILLNKKGQVKIADFGLAKLLSNAPDTALTMSQAAMGTLNYMAPEQRQNAQGVDHRADIYSLGVVFYEMLTGEVPMGRFEPPSKRVQVDARLDDVVLRALEREPARRYQQASEVKTDVETVTSTHRSFQTPRQEAPQQFTTAIQVLLALLIVSLVVGIVAVAMGGTYLYFGMLLLSVSLGILLIVVLRRHSRGQSQKAFELFPKEWSAKYDGHSIRVRNSWNRGMKLFVDDVCQTSTSRTFALSKSKPVLRCEMASGTSSYLIEVYAHAVLEVYAKIVVNGQWIGGDNF
jgi:serine/threonine protein kinase